MIYRTQKGIPLDRNREQAVIQGGELCGHNHSNEKQGETMSKFSAAAVLAIILCSCGEDPSGTQTIHEGNWSGTAADSISLSFTVSGGSVENMTVLVTYDLSSHADTTVSWVFDADITDNQFQYQDVNGLNNWELGLTMDGTFSPPDHAEGALSTYCSYSEGGSTETDSLSASWTASPD